MSNADTGVLPNTDVLRHIVDVHCHPTDAPAGVGTESMQRLAISVCAMATMQSDQSKVKQLAMSYPEKIVPCFGYHPWFSHTISTIASGSDPSHKESHYRSLFLPSSAPTNSIHITAAGEQSSNGNEGENELEARFRTLLPVLPDPRPLSTILAELRENLTAFPNAMLGEVGLDRAFHVPVDYFAHPRVLTEFAIPLEHQLTVLEAQVELAIELGRNISLHSVKSQQVTVDFLARMKAKHGERWNRISVDMHSCGLSPQTWRDVERNHDNVFLSLSTVINHKHNSLRPLIAACSANRILAESDYNDINMSTIQTWEMIKIIAEVKGWPVETEWAEDEDIDVDEEKWGVVRRLEKNWHRFKNGHHPMRQKKKRNKRRDYDSEDSNVQQLGD